MVLDKEKYQGFLMVLFSEMSNMFFITLPMYCFIVQRIYIIFRFYGTLFLAE